MTAAHTHAHLAAGLALYAEGQAFEAHERFEDAWRDESGPRRDVLQALVQICAARVKAEQGNLRGTDKLLDKARGRLEQVTAQSLLGLDLETLRANIQRAIADRARGGKGDVPLPARAPTAGIVYLHGFASSPGSAKARQIAPALEADGHEVRVPDLNAADSFRDLTVTRALAQAQGLLFERTLLVGSSLGGYVSALLQQRDPRVVAMVLMAPAFDFARRLEDRHGPEALARWRAEGVTEVEHYGYGGMHPIGYGLFEDAKTHEPRPLPTVPTYVLQGARDDVVPADVVQQLCLAAGPHVELEVVDDEHGLTDSAALALAACRRLAVHLGTKP